MMSIYIFQGLICVLGTWSHMGHLLSKKTSHLSIFRIEIREARSNYVIVVHAKVHCLSHFNAICLALYMWLWNKKLPYKRQDNQDIGASWYIQVFNNLFEQYLAVMITIFNNWSDLYLEVMITIDLSEWSEKQFERWCSEQWEGGFWDGWR